MIKGLLLYHYHLITFFLSLCPKKKKNEIFMKADYPSVLLIYTGGTIGMIENPETGALENFNLDHLLKHVPASRPISSTRPSTPLIWNLLCGPRLSKS